MMNIAEAKMMFVNAVNSLTIRGRGDLPIDRLKELEEDVKDELIDILMDRLKENDWRAVVVMGELKVKRSENMLLEILNDELNSGNERLLIYTAHSIWQIRNDEKYVDYIISLKKNTKNNSVKIEAISLLSEIWTTKTIHSIIEDLDDAEEMVRIAAIVNLLERHNVGLDKATLDYWVDTIMSANMKEAKKIKNFIIDFFNKYCIK